MSRNSWETTLTPHSLWDHVLFRRKGERSLLVIPLGAIEASRNGVTMTFDTSGDGDRPVLRDFTVRGAEVSISDLIDRRASSRDLRDLSESWRSIALREIVRPMCWEVRTQAELDASIAWGPSVVQLPMLHLQAGVPKRRKHRLPAPTAERLEAAFTKRPGRGRDAARSELAAALRAAREAAPARKKDAAMMAEFRRLVLEFDGPLVELQGAYGRPVRIDTLKKLAARSK